MVDEARSFIKHVGHVLFPRGPLDLTDASRCPACFASLPPSAVCVKCGLDLNHPDAARLRDESLTVAALMDARLELIGKIRFETAAERARLRSAASAPVAPVPAIPAPSAAASVPHPAPAAPAATPPQISTETLSAPRSHSGIQVLLLVVGVSLLSIGAIFFLIYAFLTFGLIWRSAIIASITIASIVAASTMKRRGLAATGEALSALAVVFILLDIYALRANDLLVVGDPEGRLYWGGALLLVTAGFMFWHRASNLVLVSIAGFAVFPPAAAIFAAGIARDQSFATSALITIAAFAAASLVHVVAAHGTYRAYAERVTCMIYGMLAVVAGLAVGMLADTDNGNDNTGVWMFTLAAIAAVHSVAAHGRRAARIPGFGNAFAAAAGVLLGTALWVSIFTQAEAMTGDKPQQSLLFVVVATLTASALVVEALGLKLRSSVRLAVQWASRGLWVVAASATLIPFSQSLVVAMQFTGEQASRRTTLGSATFDVLHGGWPQLTLLVIPATMAIVWWLSRQLPARIHLVLGSAGLALAFAAPLTGTLLATVIAWLALTTVAIVIISVDRRRRGNRPAHITIAAAGFFTLLLAYSSAWSSHETWALSSVTTTVLLLAARFLVDNTIARPALLGAASLVVLAAAAGAGEQLQFALSPERANPLESWLLVGLTAVAVLALSFWKTAPTLRSADHRTLWWVGLVGSSLSATVLWISSVNGYATERSALVLNLPVVSLIIAAAALALLALTMLSRTDSGHIEQRYVAAALLAPATVWALDSASRSLGLSDIAIQLAPATASVIIGALSMALRVRGFHPQVRRVSETSALLIALMTASNAIIDSHASHWLIVLLVSITLLLAAVSRDGIFGSRSLRRHFVWAAVAFGTWALWLRLDQTRVVALEAYVLPLAAVIIAIAVFTARAELRQSRLISAPLIALAGLLIAVLPLGLNAASGDGLRTLVIAGLSGALLLTACFVEPEERLVDFWGVAIIGAGVGLIVSTASRALVIASQNSSTLPELDSWLLGGVAVLALGSFGLASTRFSTAPSNTRWAVTSEALLGSAIVLLYAVETVVLLDSGSADRALDGIRIVALVTIGSALLLLTARPSARPLTHRMSYLAFALASLVGVIAYLGDLITPLEWVTVPLGAAVLAHGGIRMRRNPALRSFAALTAGLLVLMLPSLIATFLDVDSDDTAWRILAVGVAAVAAIVAGTWLKLQAPLIIGAIVALIHAAHTFAPALVSLYQLTDWWVWAVVGGGIVLFLGITLERRIRDLTALNSKFSSLR